MLDIQSGDCRYGLHWLADGVNWLPSKQIGTLIVTDFGDINKLEQDNKVYCEKTLGQKRKKF